LVYFIGFVQIFPFGRDTIELIAKMIFDFVILL